ncbi:MAG: hypothetical protein VX294_06210 [Candidatus Latescibacterota bacterium]|nr:hypothetical protein [Candidatus Latescibacterota bacterium]
MNDEIIQQSEALKPEFDNLRKRFFIIGVIGLVASLVGLFLSTDHYNQFFQSYLVAFTYWVSIPLGSLLILMIHQVGGGTWGFTIRRQLEAASRTLPLLFVFSIPILAFGIHSLYEWSHTDVLADDALLRYKASFLNESYFRIRSVVYFLIWGILIFLLSRWSAKQDNETSTNATWKMQKLSGPGIVIFFLTTTMATIDWMMSIEPHWFSTIFGVIQIIGQALIAWSFITLVSIYLADKKPIGRLLTGGRLADLGTFMLATVMLWAYTSFSQLLIIWSGNLPEEITWFITRTSGGWEYLSYGLIGLHFFFPFFFLISSTMKSKLSVLKFFACWLLLVRFFDILWYTRPTFTKIDPLHGNHYSSGFTIDWLDLAILVAIGGFVISMFFSQLKKRPLIALNDPRFPELYEADEKDDHHG